MSDTGSEADSKEFIPPVGVCIILFCLARLYSIILSLPPYFSTLGIHYLHTSQYYFSTLSLPSLTSNNSPTKATATTPNNVTAKGRVYSQMEIPIKDNIKMAFEVVLVCFRSRALILLIILVVPVQTPNPQELTLLNP